MPKDFGKKNEKGRKRIKRIKKKKKKTNYNTPLQVLVC